MWNSHCSCTEQYYLVDWLQSLCSPPITWHVCCIWYCRPFHSIQKAFPLWYIRGSTLAWFHSIYLKDRTQFVSINRTSSSLHELICGDILGSVLGHLLYVLYTSQVGDIHKHGLSFHLYADHQQLYTSFFFDGRTEMGAEADEMHWDVCFGHPNMDGFK